MKTRYIRLFIAGLALALTTTLSVQWLNERNSVNEQRAEDATLTSAPSGETDKNKAYIPASFDQVSEMGGVLRISGRAEPETSLSILDGEKIQLQVKVSDTGLWSVELPVITDEIMEISVTMFLKDNFRIMSDETVYRVPLPPMAAEQMNILMPRALILITVPGGASRIVQSPFDSAPSNGPLTLGPIDYDDMGSVIFSGNSRVAGRVRIYVNGNAIGDTRVTEDGRWYYIRADTLTIGNYEVAAELTPVNGEPIVVTVLMERLAPTVATSPDETFVKFEPQRWQLRRALRGGGGQYTVILPKEYKSDLPEDGLQEDRPQ